MKDTVRGYLRGHLDEIPDMGEYVVLLFYFEWNDSEYQSGAQTIQSFFRGTSIRLKFLNRVQKVQGATRIIWTSYRQWQDREELQKWADKKVEETRMREEMERRRKEEEERQRKYMENSIWGKHVPCEYMQCKQWVILTLSVPDILLLFYLADTLCEVNNKWVMIMIELILSKYFQNFQIALSAVVYFR